jgi:hypothetical protein
LADLCEHRIEVVFGAGIQHMQLQPERAGRRQHLTRGGLGNGGIARVDQQRHDARRWKQLVQQFQPLRRDFHRLGHARDVAAWPVQTGDEAELDRIGAGFEHDRNGRGRRLRRQCRRGAGSGNYRDVTLNQIGRQRRQPVILALRPAVFDCNVAAIDVTGLTEPFDKSRR